jgi:2-C-methyl-D-erythritol 2,4-cyclodiphosphate synthase
MLNYKIKIGQGIDVHEFSNQLEDNKILFLGGIEIPNHKALKGHSDADVVLHSIVDAILGALGLGDIGEHFPPSNTALKGMASLNFLEFAYQQLLKKNGTINNLDITILAETPKINPYKQQMKEFIAKVLNTNIEDINIKATTTETLGFVGRSEGIVAFATICIKILDN